MATPLDSTQSPGTVMPATTTTGGPAKPTAEPANAMNKSYSSMGALEAEHPEVLNAIKKTIGQHMMDDLRKAEDHRKRRLKQMG